MDFAKEELLYVGKFHGNPVYVLQPNGDVITADGKMDKHENINIRGLPRNVQNRIISVRKRLENLGYDK